MPRIFDNIKKELLPALQNTLSMSKRADFCVGYFNLRGWKQIDSYIEQLAGENGQYCRLLIGMYQKPRDQINELLGLIKNNNEIDQNKVTKLLKELIEDFKHQLTIGAPSNEDEAGLRRLAAQIKAKKVVIKMFLRNSLHAKLYLLFRSDPNNPITGFLGSSNLTFAGLSKQGELNIDVLDHDACQKLANWFEDRWNDRWCIDISNVLIDIIEESWARKKSPPPYHIYIKMAYHLSQEAREGISEFKLPKELKDKLFEFQEAAVKIAAHHINKRGGVLIGDVVGLGKTLMATALARILEDCSDLETLIICPKNLYNMWNDYRERYHLRGKVMKLSRVIKDLPETRIYRLLIIDESHNLRNREGKCYGVIRDYIKKNGSKCILLSATPYNKTYLDLSNQLRLFIKDDQELPIRPEQLISKIGEIEFNKLQCSPRVLAAFEKSEYADDWRELMRLYLIRRTRTFIMDNYAKTDHSNNRKYLLLEDGLRYFFPMRVPKTSKFKINDNDPEDQYALLYAAGVVNTINSLHLPRYGLGNYIISAPDIPPNQNETKIFKNLSRAGTRLKGFCRTNLFKRLESSGSAFILSIERHILRNYVYLYAIENNNNIPIGSQDAELLDTRFYDGDSIYDEELFDLDEENAFYTENVSKSITSNNFKARAKEIYQHYINNAQKRFKWLRPTLFNKILVEHLRSDSEALLKILKKCKDWDAVRDAKLNALVDLLTKKHPNDKVIIFTQFADTVHYLENQIKSRGIKQIAAVTGNSSDPATLAWKFSPKSNDKRNFIRQEDEFRIMLATDILSEGQNLQDCAIVVNYDIPWAIIRLVQRVGRVDRIGQEAEKILCYSFLPAEGVDRIIKLRSRIRQRLKENAEVVGTDEAFFEDDCNDQAVQDLFTEKSGILDGEKDAEVDLASYAYQIWKNAITAHPKLEKIIANMPPVCYSTRLNQPNAKAPDGVLVYLRTAEDNDALIMVDKDGKCITESQKIILDLAKCDPKTPEIEKLENHHDLVRRATEQIIQEEKSIGGQLGSESGVRSRTYTCLKQYAEAVKDSLFDIQELKRAIQDIYDFPLKDSAKNALRQLFHMQSSIEAIAHKVLALRDIDELCSKEDDIAFREPRIICSLGLSSKRGRK